MAEPGVPSAVDYRTGMAAYKPSVSTVRTADDYKLCMPDMQACTFKVDYTLENIPGREFGSVFLTEKNVNVAVAVVAAGWSKVGFSIPLHVVRFTACAQK